MKRIAERKRNPSKIKRIKRLIQKIRKSKGELTENKILLFFELRKELGDDYTWNKDKNDKVLARRIYKSFEKTYP